MTQTRTPAVAAAILSVFVTLAGLAGIDGLATKQYAIAERVALVSSAVQMVDVQRVVIIGHRAVA